MLTAPDIALSTCEITLKPQSCSRRDCGRKVVRLIAVSDFIDDGDRRTRIITEPARSQSPLWKSHDPTDAFVLSKDIETPRCHLFTESYIKTLANRYYRIPTGVTTFVLYKSTTRPFEVHTRFWACSKSRNPGFCACGITARDGDDVIVIDMCNGRFLETSVQISIKSRLPLAKGIRITEAISGKRYTVYFPSGVYVRTDVFEWGLNVQIQSSGRDFNHVTGLCGLGEVTSSFQAANKGLPPEMNGTQQWRRRKSAPAVSLSADDTNTWYGQRCLVKETLPNEFKRCKSVVFMNVDKISQTSFTRQTSQNKSNQSNPFDDGKTDAFLAALAVSSYCKRLLTDTPLGRACNPVVGQRNVDNLLRICIRDMRYTGVSSMAWGAAVMLQDSCEDLVMKNTSAWEMSSSSNRPTPPTSITSTMCSRMCNDRGRCINGTCKCRRGYTSDDCSVPSRSPPQLISVHNDGECDMRAFLCKQVRLVGEGFHNSRDLMCSLAEITEASGGTQTFLSKATYESFRGVTCEVPRSHDTDSAAFSGYQVRVSNDGNLWSQPVTSFYP
ncbi:hypothetical protein OS493_032700 [Desmophyllum pertusum]|uniref:VWFD domain-containing protein n=1 Tax=Desmophyllum pertusum TaxID=174260 RepID=A0A9X0D6H9_9CNID|nr:hypothetical protein OS493_032700 [Desmophyllum pertusum]